MYTSSLASFSLYLFTGFHHCKVPSPSLTLLPCLQSFAIRALHLLPFFPTGTATLSFSFFTSVPAPSAAGPADAEAIASFALTSSMTFLPSTSSSSSLSFPLLLLSSNSFLLVGVRAHSLGNFAVGCLLACLKSKGRSRKLSFPSLAADNRAANCEPRYRLFCAWEGKDSEPIFTVSVWGSYLGPESLISFPLCC